MGLAAQGPSWRRGSLRMRVRFYGRNYNFNSIIWLNQLYNQMFQCFKYVLSKLQKITLVRSYMV